MTEIVDHLSSFLGHPSSSDRLVLDQAGRSIGLLRFENQPCPGATTVVTNGLSQLPHLHLEEELVVACWTEELSSELLLVVGFIARQLAEGRAPLLYGDVIGPAGPLVVDSPMEALYVCEPTYFPEGFAAFNASGLRRVRLRWLIPIYAGEAHLIEQVGAGRFEDLLVEHDPDLLSLRRPAMPSDGLRQR